MNLTALGSLTASNRNDPLGQADILDPQLHQLRGPHAGLQQGLQHETRAAVLGIGVIEKAQFFFDREPVHATATRGRGVQSGAFAGDFEHGFALRIVDALADEDGGNGGGGA